MTFGISFDGTMKFKGASRVGRGDGASAYPELKEAYIPHAMIVSWRR
jgi:hypothetical protein